MKTLWFCLWFILIFLFSWTLINVMLKETGITFLIVLAVYGCVLWFMAEIFNEIRKS
jgi:hypothetical protein